MASKTTAVVPARRLIGRLPFHTAQPRGRKDRCAGPVPAPGLLRGHVGHRAECQSLCWLNSLTSSKWDRRRLRPLPPPGEARHQFGQPKSRILVCPRLVMKMLAGLRSRWMIPHSCAESRASEIWMAIVKDLSALQRLARYHVLESLAFQEFHHNERMPLPFVDLVNCADIGMVETRGGPCFPLKSL